ncbi:MAG: 50S ribosomal protein L3 [Candidatus Moranbacteria bacterium]|nr:50S ribosomal protein L3 [Candidatus Moranbacteria bacterium]
MYIIGTKANMTQVWDKNNKVIAVTKVFCEENEVIEEKKRDKSGYQSVVLTDGKRVKEFPYLEDENLKQGKKIDVTFFKEGDKIKVTGKSKGKGFQGVVKRHGFSGGQKTHGHRHDLRRSGSIGSAFPQHVMKGKKMAGRMGNDQTTIKNLEVIGISKEEKSLLIKGALPGCVGSIVFIKKV